MVGFSGFLSISTSLHAELRAVLFRLQLAWDRGIRHLECNSNSKTAIQLIKHGVNPHHAYTSLICKIREFLSASWVVTLDHTFCEANSCVDWLAKHGACYDAQGQ